MPVSTPMPHPFGRRRGMPPHLYDVSPATIARAAAAAVAAFAAFGA